jgi:hypothetical protein
MNVGPSLQANALDRWISAEFLGHCIFNIYGSARKSDNE